VILYYIMLFFARFHDDPRLGGTLFNAGFLMVSPVKIVGGLALIAALISARPSHAAARQPNSLVALFLFLPVLPFTTATVSGVKVPDEWLSHVLSFITMLLATRLLVCTDARMQSTIRALVLVYLFSTLWIFKQHFLLNEDRVYGLEGDPNYEAVGLVMVMPLAVWLAHHEKQNWLRKLAFLSVPVLIYATLFTESRGGALALAVLSLGAFMRSKHKAIIVAGLIAILPIAAVALPTGFVSRIGNTRLSGIPVNGDEESSRIHFELMRAGIRMMEAKPIFGIGLGRFPELVESYNIRLVNLTGQPFVAHNTYLQVGSECGFPVLAIWLGLMFVGFTNLRDAQQLARSRSLSDLALAMRFALLAYAISVFFLTAEWVFPYWLLIFLSQSLRELAAAQDASVPKVAVGRDAVSPQRHLPMVARLLDA
jgi:O-antigen ligase